MKEFVEKLLNRISCRVSRKVSGRIPDFPEIPEQLHEDFPAEIAGIVLKESPEELLESPDEHTKDLLGVLYEKLLEKSRSNS